jgi:hypothetical protein
MAVAVLPTDKTSVWEHRIAQWGRSGLSQRDFCREQRLALSTFQWWRARLKRRAALPAATFLPLALEASDVVEVTLRSNTRVRVQGPSATRVVEALIARLR